MLASWVRSPSIKAEQAQRRPEPGKPRTTDDMAGRTADLIAAIQNFIGGWNDRCHAFTWT